MLESKWADLRDIDLVSAKKPRDSSLKVSWTTYQGSRKRRGNPTVQYLKDR